MKSSGWRVRKLILAVVLVAPWPLVLSGCGDSTPSGPPANIGGLKTPSEVLEEAKAKEKAAKP